MTTATQSVTTNARQHLRNLFAKEGTIKSKKEVFASFLPVTINTHLTDLKNPKYAGSLGCLNIVKLNDGNYQRVANSAKQNEKYAAPKKAA
jgi:hypothetical protein